MTSQRSRHLRSLLGSFLRRSAGAVVTLAGSLLLATCSDTQLGPNHPGLGTVSVAAVFPTANLTAFNLALDHVRLIVVHAGPPPDTLANSLDNFSVSSTQLQLDATIALHQAAETLQVSLQYLSGTTLLFTQTGSAVVREGPPGTSPPVTLASPVYVGPGANLATLTLSPRDTTLTAGAVFPFRVTAADSLGSPVTAFYVDWTSGSSASPIDAAGTLRAQATRGSFQLHVKTPSGVADSTQVTIGLPAKLLVKVSGDSQPAAPAGSQLSQPLVVQVQASDGLGVPNVPVSFTASTGGGSVSPATALTDTAGKAQAIATLGPTAGPNSFTATSSVGQVTFRETATAVTGPASRLFIATQPSTTAQSGVVLAQQPVVQLRDSNNANVSQAGVPVTASLTGGSGTISGTLTVNTNASGQAVFTGLAISGTAGTRTLTFSASGLTSATSGSITLSAGLPATIAIQAGNNQSATVGTAVTVPPSVLVTDGAANPVTGVPVTFAVASGGGTVVPTTPVTTGSTGLATVTSWTLGATPGPNTLTATVTGLTAVTFTATGNAAGPTITLSVPGALVGIGAGQQAQAVVTLSPAASANGVTVTVTSDSTQYVTVQSPGTLFFAPGVSVGSIGLGGVAAGVTVLHATASGYTAGTATAAATPNFIALTYDSVGVGQTATLGVSLSTTAPAGGLPVLLISEDSTKFKFINGAVTNPPVGSFVDTVQAGNTQVNTTITGLAAGTVPVVAAATNYAVGIEVVVVTPFTGTVALASGGGQVGGVNTKLPQPITVKVLNALGAPVSGFLVSFTVASGGGSVSPVAALTDTSGQASTTWTLGPTPGTQSLTVTATGATGSPLTVSATAQ